MYYRLVLLLVLCCINLSIALGLSDFESEFLSNIHLVPESSAQHATVKKNSKPVAKFNCNGGYSGVSSIFCGKSESVSGNGGVIISDDSDSTNVVGVPLKNYAVPDVNENSLHTPVPLSAQKTPQGELFNSLSVPIQTSKNLNLNISPQQIELNIKY